MFHVEPQVPAELEGAAAQIFGDRLPVAIKYAQWLAGEGVTRGLIGPREVDRLWARHILNCAVLGEAVDHGARVVDVGSGAGLPGIPLAIARPDLTVVLVEPLLRRTTFLGEVVKDLELPVAVVRGRAEQPGVVREVGGADYVTSRAVAPLEKLIGWSIPLVREGGMMVALKGSSAAEEIERARPALDRLGVSEIDIRLCGEGLLETPTTVVRAVRAAHRRGGRRR